MNTAQLAAQNLQRPQMFDVSFEILNHSDRKIAKQILLGSKARLNLGNIFTTVFKAGYTFHLKNCNQRQLITSPSHL